MCVTMNILKRVQISLLVLVLPAAFVSAAQAQGPSLAEEMTRFLECYPVELVVRDQQNHAIRQKDVCLATIYHETGAQPLWVTADGPGTRAAVILKYLKNAAEEGLDAGSYEVEEIEALWHDPSLSSLARLDTLLTFNAVKYIHNVNQGEFEPYVVDPELFAEAGKQQFTPVDIVERMIAATDLDRFFRQMPPQNMHYRALKAGLAVYRNMEQSTALEEIERNTTIHPGDNDGRIPLIRGRLALFAGRVPDQDERTLYDDHLEEQILLFQELHGLQRDGLIGPQTIAALNISPAERVEQIRVNMARWRWQDHDIGEEYVLVNIANFRLYAYRGGELQLNIPVIVGQFQHQTPVFSDQIKYLEINPFWNIPPSIAVNEKLSELRENPHSLVEKNIRLFSSWQEDGIELDSTAIDWAGVTPGQMARYKLRQDPGPSNALGQLKFVFPNHYSVYLHDTPTKNLFTKERRYFSHGCIRVSTPVQLAVFMLEENEQSWNEAKIRELIASQKRKVLRISPPLPVHLTYQTAWVDKNGRIHFNEDIYARDKKLLKALNIK